MSQIPKLPKKKVPYYNPGSLNGSYTPVISYYDAYEIEAWHAEVFKNTRSVYLGPREWNNWTEIPNVDQTHSALLINVQAIKEEPETGEETDKKMSLLHPSIKEKMQNIDWQDRNEELKRIDEKVLLMNQRLQTALMALYAIACWEEGDEVAGKFDEPASAKTARDTIKKIRELG